MSFLLRSYYEPQFIMKLLSKEKTALVRPLLIFVAAVNPKISNEVLHWLRKY